MMLSLWLSWQQHRSHADNNTDQYAQIGNTKVKTGEINVALEK